MISSKRKYRSGLEEEVGALLEPAGFQYEPYKITYWTPGTYTPDFVVQQPDGIGDYLIEVKGYFRAGDTKKYKAINSDLPAGDELIFVLQYPHKKVRKGSKITLSQWCEKHGIKWFAKGDIHGLLAYTSSGGTSNANS